MDIDNVRSAQLSYQPPPHTTSVTQERIATINMIVLTIYLYQGNRVGNIHQIFNTQSAVKLVWFQSEVRKRVGVRIDGCGRKM